MAKKVIYRKYRHKDDRDIQYVIKGSSYEYMIVASGLYLLVDDNDEEEETWTPPRNVATTEQLDALESKLRNEIKTKGTGDMMKISYDTNNNYVVDRAERADAMSWYGRL